MTRRNRLKTSSFDKLSMRLGWIPSLPLGGGEGQGEVGVGNAERPRLTRRAYFFRMYLTMSAAAPAMMR
jgi:hypothetical protein